MYNNNEFLRYRYCVKREKHKQSSIICWEVYDLMISESVYLKVVYNMMTKSCTLVLEISLSQKSFKIQLGRCICLSICINTISTSFSQCLTGIYSFIKFRALALKIDWSLNCVIHTLKIVFIQKHIKLSKIRNTIFFTIRILIME